MVNQQENGKKGNEEKKKRNRVRLRKWDKNCPERKTKKRIQQEHKNDRNRENRISEEYTTTRKEYEKPISVCKNEKWKELCKKIHGGKHTKSL